MKKKLVVTTLSLCMILAAAPAQAFASCTPEAGTSNLLSDCKSTIVKSCFPSLKLNCDGNNTNYNKPSNWQNQIQEYLDKYMGGSNIGNSGSTGNGSQNNGSGSTGNGSQNNGSGSTGNGSQNNGSGSTGNGSQNNGGTTNDNNGSSNIESDTAIGSYEQQVVDLVNKERAAAGLNSLKLDSKLSAVAEKKAEDMRDNNYFSHTSPTYGSPFEMMKQFGISYSAAGENIAKGQKTPQSVMNAWMNSSGHKANILSTNFENIGVGYVTDSKGNTYWVQMFTK